MEGRRQELEQVTTSRATIIPRDQLIYCTSPVKLVGFMKDHDNIYLMSRGHEEVQFALGPHA